MQGLIRRFLPKEDHFFGFLENQGALCHEAALAFAQFKAGQSAEQVRDAVQLVEHRADDFVRQMEDALARTFVTPLDREDLHKLASTPLQGFAAETSGALTILAASHFGVPVSTTHCINACIMGVGASKRVSAVRWGVASNILMAWVLTLPLSAALAWVAMQVLSIVV